MKIQRLIQNDFNLKGITIGKGNVIATKKGDLLTLLAGKGINLLSDIKNKIITDRLKK